MAAEVLRIEVPIEVKDNTKPGVDSAQKKLTAFDKANEKTQKRLDEMSKAKWKVVLEAVDKVTTVVAIAGKAVKGLAGRAWSFTISAIDKVTAPVKSMISAVSKLMGMGTLASTVLGGMSVVDMLSASSSQGTVEKQLETVLANVTDSENAMDRLKSKASSMQSDTMYGDEAYLAGAAELATYLSDVNALEKAMEVLSDYAAGMSGGAEVSIEQMVNYATQLGKALNGPDAAFDGLTKKGFAFSEAQEEILKSDLTSDMEKISVLAEVIGESWDGLAEAFANTPTARVTQFKNAWGDMKEVIGGKLWPSVGGFFQMLSTKIPAVQSLLEKGADWLNSKIEQGVPTLEKWIDGGIAKIEKLSGKVEELFGSERFQSADTLRKIEIAWDEIIAKPFSDWWDSTGKAWFAEKAAHIGKGIGTGLTVGLLAILGIDTGAAKKNGIDIGRSFAEGFSKGFDADKIGNAFVKWGNEHKGIVAAAGAVVGFNLVTGIADAMKQAVSIISVVKSFVAAFGTMSTGIGIFIALAAAIAGVTIALVELDKRRNVETREVENMIKAHKELIEEYNRSVDAIQTEHDDIEHLVEQYAILSEKENRSAREKSQLLAVTEKLNEIMPELGLQYDYYTDKVNGSAEAVKNLAKAEYMRSLMAEDKELIVSLTAQNYEYADKAKDLRAKLEDIYAQEDALDEKIKNGTYSWKAGFEMADLQAKEKDIKAALSSLQIDWAVSTRELNNASDRYTQRAENYEKAWDAYTESTGQHAWGGIIQSPHMAMVAEDGAEAIIPLSPSKRQRGLDLWQEAGQTLGVQPYEDGGIAGDTMPISTTTVEGGASNHFDIHIEVSPEFVIEARDAGFDGESLVSIVREHIREMADDIGDEIADRLARVFSNMPVKGTA